jgi:hypothetical protein
MKGYSAGTIQQHDMYSSAINGLQGEYCMANSIPLPKNLARQYYSYTSVPTEAALKIHGTLEINKLHYVLYSKQSKKGESSVPTGM